jgi:hypothetical protein
MEGIFRFLASPWGRIVRAVAGLLLIYAGLVWVGGLGGGILAVVGLIPLVAGGFDFCVFAPIFRLPFGGTRLRQALKERMSA